MAILDFFKTFLRKEEDIKKREGEISLENAEKWLDENTSELSKEFIEKVGECFNLIREGIEEMEVGLRDLQNYRIDESLNERAKTTIVQNKENYVKYSQRLIDFFRTNQNIERKVGKVEDFVKVAMWELDMFSRQSARGFQISSSVIGKEFEKILVGLKKISNAVNHLRKLDKTDYKVVETIKGLIVEIRSHDKLIEKIKTVRVEEMKKLGDLKKDKEKLVETEKKIKNNEEWKKKQKLEEEMGILEGEQNIKYNEIKELFFAIEKIIQKYSWKEKKKEVLAYVEDPIGALKEDEGLKILDDIDKMRKEIEEKVYTLDEKRKNQLLTDINKISEKVLLDFLEQEMIFEKEIGEKREEIKMLRIEEINFKEIEDKIIEVEENISKIGKKEEFVKIEEEDLKKRMSLLLEDLGKQMGKDIKINL